ncbi:MAG: hypothetical protein AB3N28_01455 [Kordiimonas sp.]
MMKRLLISGLLLVLGVATVFMYRDYRKEQCISWFEKARTEEKSGYFASAIETLTIYFTTDACRSKLDPRAVAILANARIHVPLPDNNHLAQQLMLNKLGWSLKRDPQFHLPEATALLGAGRWKAAQKAALKVKGYEGALILIAASVKLKDATGLEYGLLHLRDSDASQFQWAVVSNLMQDQMEATADLHRLLPKLPRELKDFVSAILSDDLSIGAFEKLNDGTFLTTELDLKTASSLLIAGGKFEETVSLIETNADLVTEQTALTLSKVRWRLGQYERLASGDPLVEKVKQASAEIKLVECLAQLSTRGECVVTFSVESFSARHGKFAAAKWARLFDVLSAPSLNIKNTINAINAAEDLFQGVGPIHQYQAALLEEIGEPELAQNYAIKGMVLSGEAPEWANIQAATLESAEYDCSGDMSSKAFDVIPAWQRCVENGQIIPAVNLEKLKSISPDQATFWRMVEARNLLQQENDEDAAKAINLLRPIIRWVPEKARPHQLIASAYAYFDDMEAAYGHIATSVKLNPEFSIEASRLALGLYLNEQKLSAEQLVHWWVSLTYIELAARNNKNSNKARLLLRDRLLLLAELAEQGKDAKLAKAAYAKLLEAETNNHVALNNLAYKIFETDGDLHQALKLAQKAVLIAPKVLEYGKTLKDIQIAIEEAEVS